MQSAFWMKRNTSISGQLPQYMIKICIFDLSWHTYECIN